MQSTEPSEIEDLNLIMKHTYCSYDRAYIAYHIHKRDLLDAILCVTEPIGKCKSCDLPHEMMVKFALDD